MPKRRGTAARRPSRATRRSPVRSRGADPPKFVGRDGSPVLDRYPPKDPALSVRGPPPIPTSQIPVKTLPAPSAATPPGSGVSTVPPGPLSTGAGTSASTPKPLILLEKPFDLDEFAQLLGETTIRVEVPREDLAEALRRISDFMGFGIYVYSFQVRPAPEELLKRFVIELQRVDFSSTRSDWIPFEEKGRSDSPFGPSGGRR